VNEKASGRAFADAGKGAESPERYEPPAIERMGSLAELTQGGTIPHSGNGNPWTL
jgi:hypothetical protein